MPGRQLQQVAAAHSIFIELLHPLGIEGARMEGSQIVGAAGQAALQLFGRYRQESGQLGA